MEKALPKEFGNAFMHNNLTASLLPLHAYQRDHADSKALHGGPYHDGRSLPFQ
jgi:hypothetical protein